MRTRPPYIIPAALRCFFHVYEEPLGRYGFGVQKHVLLISPWKMACGRAVGFDDYVTVYDDVVVIDRDWCQTCAAAVHSKLRHDSTLTAQRPLPSQEIA